MQMVISKDGYPSKKIGEKVNRKKGWCRKEAGLDDHRRSNGQQIGWGGPIGGNLKKTKGRLDIRI